ncbi:MAG: phosphonate ABC transporter, permease protein PhnE [Chloroflexi bacterium]|nr:phosphonate ABC transporter, permease protein PhnE [Chloroflexota bacterium]
MRRLPAATLLRTLWTLALVALIGAAFALSVQVTDPDFVRLITAAPKARQILPQLLSPDLVARDSQTVSLDLDFPIPCGSAAEGVPASSGSSLLAVPGCAEVRERFMLSGAGFPPQAIVKLSWVLPSGDPFGITRVTVGDDGTFGEELQARPIAAAAGGVPARLRAEWSLPGGVLQPSQALIDVTQAIMVTIFMALLATTIGTIAAAPLSFLAASNITRKGPLGTAVYYLARSVFNVGRSFEPLVMALIFALIVGFGSPFAGVLGMTVMTAASLGKMFSESVESIDPGPIEAVQASGANRWQVVRYAVVPQIIPDFLSFIIYHWDINVRISTIIGFVGGGGIGYYLSQRISTLEYSKAGTGLLAIVIVVWVLDFLSAQIRKRAI